MPITISCPLFSELKLGGGRLYKPRGQTKSEGVPQMTTTINNSYLVKVSTYLGERVKIHVVCTCPLGRHHSGHSIVRRH